MLISDISFHLVTQQMFHTIYMKGYVYPSARHQERRNEAIDVHICGNFMSN